MAGDIDEAPRPLAPTSSCLSQLLAQELDEALALRRQEARRGDGVDRNWYALPFRIYGTLFPSQRAAVLTDGTWTLLWTPNSSDAADLGQTIEAKTAQLSLDVVSLPQVPAADCVGVTPYRIL